LIGPGSSGLVSGESDRRIIVNGGGGVVRDLPAMYPKPREQDCSEQPGHDPLFAEYAGAAVTKPAARPKVGFQTQHFLPALRTKVWFVH